MNKPEYDYQTIYTAVDGRAVAGPWNWSPECVIEHRCNAQSLNPRSIAASYLKDALDDWGNNCAEWREQAVFVVVRWKPHNQPNYNNKDKVVGGLADEA